MTKLLFLLVLAGMSRYAVAQPVVDSLEAQMYRAWKEHRYVESVRLGRLAASLATDTSNIVSLLEFVHAVTMNRLPGGKTKAALLQAINEGPRYSNGQKREWGVSLAGIYLSEGLFDSALYMLNYSLKLPELSQRCFDISNFGARYQHKRMLALEGLGLRDSAINVFMPHAFQSVRENECRPGEEEYATMVADFVRILRSRYSDAELAREAESMLLRSDFDITPDKVFSMYPYRYTFVTRFMGRSVTATWSSFGTEFQLENLLRTQRADLQRSVLYRLLRGVPSGTASL